MENCPPLLDPVPVEELPGPACFPISATVVVLGISVLIEAVKGIICISNPDLLQ